MNAPSHLSLLGLLLCRYLTCGDLYRVSLCSREWHALLFYSNNEEDDRENGARNAIWSVLIRRDFCRDRKGGLREYAKLTRQAWHWRLGRTRPPVVVGRRRSGGRMHRLLVNPEEDTDAESCLCVEMRNIDGAIEAYLGNGTPIALHAPGVIEENEAKQGRLIANAVMTKDSQAKHERLSVLCSGIGACWVDTYSWGSGNVFSRTDLTGTESNQTYLVGQYENSIYAAEVLSTTGRPTVLLWDWNRPELPVQVSGEETMGATVIGFAVADSHTCIMTLSNGSISIGDFRGKTSRTFRSQFPCEVQTSCFLGENQQLVMAFNDTCALVDLRYLNHDFVSVWEERKVYTLAKVSRNTVVAGINDGWGGPLISLNVTQGSVTKRLQYSGEKSYHVWHLSANRCMLAASCTDWTRLFLVA